MTSSLQEAVDGFYAACNQLLSGDPSRMPEIWSDSDDITHLGPTGEIHRGRQAVMAQMARESAQFKGSYAALDPHIVATADMAYVVCTERSEGMDLNGQQITVNVCATTIFRKQEGHWFVVHNHTDHL